LQRTALPTPCAGVDGVAGACLLGHVVGLLANRLTATHALGRFGVTRQAAPAASAKPTAHKLHDVSERDFELTLDSNMQGRYAACQVVIVHMSETTYVHQGL